MNIKIYYLIVGASAGIVSITSFFFVIFNWSSLASGWMFPLWLSFAAILTTGSVSFMSFRLVSEKNVWL